MAIRFRTVALAAALLLVLVGCGSAGSATRPAATVERMPTAPRTVIIVLENHEFDEVIGNRDVPFLNSLSRRGALASRYYAITHPSLPNYLAILGGSTFGIANDCTACVAPGPGLPEQLSESGVSWRAYMEGLPYPCFAGAEKGDYVKKHNPFMYFEGIAGDPARCRNVVPGTQLETDLRRHSLPAFAWFTPNLCHDAHDCGLEVADRAMANLVPRLQRQLGREGRLIVTFDEGLGHAGCCAVASGGRVMTIVAGPGVPSSTRLGDRYTHYSLLAGLEDRYGLPRLRRARGAEPLPLSFDEASLK
jgi:hypothetical protein